MGKYLCPRCLTCLDQVPDIGKDCDCARRSLRNYARDSAARVEDARRIIFDMGMSVGGELAILKNGSLVPTRVIHPHRLYTLAYVFQNAYYTELGINPAELMSVDPLHDWDIGVGKAVFVHNVRILHAIGRSAINLFDAR